MPLFADVTSAVAEDWSSTPSIPTASSSSSPATSSSSSVFGLLKRIGNNGNSSGSSTAETWIQHDTVIKRTTEFLNTPSVTMNAENSICVLQREACLYPVTSTTVMNTTSGSSLSAASFSSSSACNTVTSSSDDASMHVSLSSSSASSSSLPPLRPTYIGSTDATTCVIVFLHGRPALGSLPVLLSSHPVTAATLVAHLDTIETIDSYIGKITDLLKYIPGGGSSILNPLELSIIGSYDKEQHTGTSDELVTTLLRKLDKLRLNIQLNIAMVWNMNTKYIDEHKNIVSSPPPKPKSLSSSHKPLNGPTPTRPSPSTTVVSLPCFTSAAINIHTGQVMPCTFPDNSIGPYQIERTAGCWTNDYSLPYCFSLVTHQYSVPRNDLMKYTIDAFTIIYLLSLNDKEFLRVTSTSPDAEGPHFVSVTKNTLRFILDSINNRDRMKDHDDSDI